MKVNNTFVKLGRKSFSDALKEIHRFNPKIKIEDNFTPPSSWYLRKDIFELEMEKIFKRNWIGTRGDEQLKQVNNYITGDIIGQPYIVANSKDRHSETSSLKAFYNVCAHKGAHVAKGSGSSEEFVCPYHGWTYNNSGNLIKATSMTGIKNFRNKENGLKPIAMDKYAYMMFLNFAEESQRTSFSKLLSPVVENMKNFNYDPTFSDIVFIGRREYLLKANWKLYGDNFNDGDYHIPYLHKSLDTWNYAKTDSTTVYDKVLIQLSKFKAADRSRGLGGVYCYIYPNTMIGRFGEHLHSIVSEPISETETNMVIESYIIKELQHDQKAIKESLDFIELLHLEDTMICESVQKGLKSDGFDMGRYSPVKEYGTFAFHQMIYDDLTK